MWPPRIESVIAAARQKIQSRSRIISRSGIQKTNMADADRIGAPIESIGVNRQAHAGYTRERPRSAKYKVANWKRSHFRGGVVVTILRVTNMTSDQ